MFMLEELKMNGTIVPFDELADTFEIDTPLGAVWIRPGEDRCWVSNELVTEDSCIFANLQTLDTTAKNAIVTEQTDGNFVIRLDTNCTGAVRVAFLVATPK